jgi:glycerol-3-phosphate acyltransferase PlsY
MLTHLVFLALTYLTAAVPFGLVVTTLAGGDIDVRAAGSGNIGTTNVARLYGWRTAALVLALDVAKGLLPVLYARAIDGDASVVWLATVGAAAFVGHCFPVYLGFAGGKGVATGAGALLGIAPSATLSGALVWGAVLATTGRSSIASLFAAGAVVGMLWSDPELGWIAVGLALAILATHTSNVRRIFSGTEGAVVRPVRWGGTPEPSRDAIEALLHEPVAGSLLQPQEPPPESQARP